MAGVGQEQEGPLERELAQIGLKRKLQQELEKTKKAKEEMLGQKKAFAKEKEELERARKEQQACILLLICMYPPPPMTRSS